MLKELDIVLKMTGESERLHEAFSSLSVAPKPISRAPSESANSGLIQKACVQIQQQYWTMDCASTSGWARPCRQECQTPAAMAPGPGPPLYVNGRRPAWLRIVFLSLKLLLSLRYSIL